MSNRQLFLDYLAQTSDAPLDLEIVKADGTYLTDVTGKRYIDLISGISVCNLGHNNPRIIKAIKNQVDNYMHLMVYGEYVQEPQIKLAQKLAGLLPPSLSSVYFVNSGSEAIEGAMKLAKRYTGRHHIVSFKNAYHGSTHGALSIMGDEHYKNAFRPLLPGITIANYNDEESLGFIGKDTAAVFIEPIQAEAGIIVPSATFLKKIREMCTQNGVLLVVDEIQTGMGRTGKLFGFEQFNITPDIITLAKAFGGGMPLGAFVASKEVMGALSHNPALGHITTFGGHPVCCAAALEALNILMEENLIEKVSAKNKMFKQLLQHRNVVGIRDAGLLMALQLESFDQVKKTIKGCLDDGVITDWFLFCDNAIRIAPPLTITENEIEMACSIIKRGLDKL